MEIKAKNKNELFHALYDILKSGRRKTIEVKELDGVWKKNKDYFGEFEINSIIINLYGEKKDLIYSDIYFLFANEPEEMYRMCNKCIKFIDGIMDKVYLVDKDRWIICDKMNCEIEDLKNHEIKRKYKEDVDYYVRLNVNIDSRSLFDFNEDDDNGNNKSLTDYDIKGKLEINIMER